MTELPRHLAPWGPALSPLARDLQLTIGPHVARIALAVGPLHTSRIAESDEPDGVANLSRRGSYERLLVTEWALADEVPDEFLRRAAMREQLFIEVARRAPAGAARSVVLFDAGPSQLGNPRVAHLAALVVFARRAADAGADLYWGVLQDLAAGLHHGLTRDNAARLLAGRSAMDASDTLIDAWIRHAGAPGRPDDLWLVGPERIAPIARRAGASALTVRDVLVPRARRLELRAHRGALHHAPITLDMPDEGDCVRLLRNPFDVDRAPAPTRSPGGPLDLESHLQLSADGKRLLARTRRGFAAWPIPTSKWTEPGNVKRFNVPRGHKLVAAGTYRRRRTAVTFGDEASALPLHVHGIAHPDSHGRSEPVSVAGPWDRVFRAWRADEVADLPPCVLAASPASTPPVITFLAPNGELFAVPTLTGNCAHPQRLVNAEHIHSDVIAFAPSSGGVTAVVADAARSVSVMLLRPSERALMATIEHIGSPNVFIGHDPSCYPLPGPVAVSVSPWTWEILHGRDAARHDQNTADVTCGVAVRNGEPGLIVYDGEGTLFFCGSRRIELVRTQSVIASACASASTDRIAWITETGEVGVYSLARGHVLMNVRAGEGS